MFSAGSDWIMIRILRKAVALFIAAFEMTKTILSDIQRHVLEFILFVYVERY